MGESGVWGFTMHGGEMWTGCRGGGGAGGYMLVGPRVHGGAVWDNARDVWGLQVYTLVGARCVEGGLGCMAPGIMKS